MTTATTRTESLRNKKWGFAGGGHKKSEKRKSQKSRSGSDVARGGMDNEKNQYINVKVPTRT